MHSYPPGVLDTTLQEDWARDVEEGPNVEASFMMMNQAILMMPKAQVIDSRLQD